MQQYNYIDSAWEKKSSGIDADRGCLFRCAFYVGMWRMFSRQLYLCKCKQFIAQITAFSAEIW